MPRRVYLLQAPRSAHEPVRLLANATNRALLGELAKGPSYARELATRMGHSEDDVQRKLHRMERAGLVRSAWAHHGKTVKEYVLAAARVAVELDAAVRVTVEPREG